MLSFNRPGVHGKKILRTCVLKDFSTFWRKATFTQSFCSQRWNSSSKRYVLCSNDRKELSCRVFM